MNQNFFCGFRMPNARAFAFPIPMMQIPQNRNTRLQVFVPFAPSNLLLQNYTQNLNKPDNDVQRRVFLPLHPSRLPLQDPNQNLNKGSNPNGVGERVFLPFMSNVQSLQSSSQNQNEAHNSNTLEEKTFASITSNSSCPNDNAQNATKLHLKDEKERVFSKLKSNILCPQEISLYPNATDNIITCIEEIVPDFKCETCGSRIPTYLEFMQHNRYHEDADDKSSSSSSSSSDSLFIALAEGSAEQPDDKTSNGSDVTVFSYPYCERIFKYYSGLDNHVKMHEIKKPLACAICKTKFSRDSSLRKHHLMLHSQNRVRRHCPYCIYRCFQSSDMEKHIARRHTRDFKFKCSLCTKGFTTPKELNNHIRRKHPNVKIMTTSKVERNNIGATGSTTVKENDIIPKFPESNYLRKFRKCCPIFKSSTSILTSKAVLVDLNKKSHEKIQEDEKSTPQLKNLEECNKT